MRLTYSFLISISLWSVNAVYSQQNTLFMHQYYRDQLYHTNRTKTFLGNGFLPYTENEFDLNQVIRDSSRQYYDFTELLFKKHLFEAKGKNYTLHISPAADLQIGKDIQDTSERRLFQNTRGIVVEVDLFKNFSFFTSFFENQGRYSRYQTTYYQEAGEMYPNQSNGQYSVQNASIPGAGRTKPFKNDGFDYAFAMGNLVYKIHPKLTLLAGNTPQFIGFGYRSILHSDNTAPAPFLRFNWKPTAKLTCSVYRSRLINLIRKPVSTSVEAYYETKGHSILYLSYQPSSNISISFFEGIIWSKGDSIISKRVHPLFYNPLPFLSDAFLSEAEINSMHGLNLALRYKSVLIYGQFAVGQLNFKRQAWQMGMRGYGWFGLPSLMAQLEYNRCPDNFYSSSYSRLNFSHFNQPLAHVKGNGFHEIVLRGNYEYQRCYLDIKTIFYLLSHHASDALLPANNQVIPVDGTTWLQWVELGYRLNRKMNLSVFLTFTTRGEQTDALKSRNTFLMTGIRTGIFNQYSDF